MDKICTPNSMHIVVRARTMAKTLSRMTRIKYNFMAKMDQCTSILDKRCTISLTTVNCTSSSDMFWTC